MGSPTETDRDTLRTEHQVPVLKLLFSGESGVTTWQRAVSGPQVLIGREVTPAQGLPLPDDRRASGRHARIHRDAAGVHLTDLGSKNGTLVNGTAVGEKRLGDGDVIRIGNSLLLLRYEAVELKDAPPGPAHEHLIGVAPATRELRFRIARVAPQTAPVLLQGATGTGKELTARAIHELSSRTGPLVSVNTAAIPHSLAESMLFGHAAGAFTGARQHTGFFLEAAGGTLFLDEIGELPYELQPKLLRVLEQGEVLPLGARRPEPCAIRFVAATNRDLRRAVAAGTFRADLRERLAGLIIELPSLQSRREDILPLFLRYLRLPSKRLTARLGEALLLYPWEGNVRELINVADHARTYADEEPAIDLPQVLERLRPLPTQPAAPAPAPSAAPASPAPIEPRRRGEYSPELVERLMHEHEGKIAQVAERLGVSRRQLSRVLEKLHLNPDRFRRQR